jgi:hypothetical protein
MTKHEISFTFMASCFLPNEIILLLHITHLRKQKKIISLRQTTNTKRWMTCSLNPAFLVRETREPPNPKLNFLNFRVRYTPGKI